MSTTEPSETHSYCQVSYVWFTKKAASSSQNEAQHFFMIIQLTWVLSPDVRNIVFPVIQRIAFHAPPKNLLFCIIKNE